MKVTKEQWKAARERWEESPKQGYKWLIEEMGLDVTANHFAEVRKREGWKKKKGGQPGRPTKFYPEMCEQARQLCLLGATNADLRRFFNIKEDTFNRWMREKLEFSTAVKSGREVADSKVALRFFERACGYEHDHEEIKVVNDEIVRVPTVKRYPPDTAAAFIWLKNRRPDMWRDKKEVEQTTEVRFPDRKELDQRYEQARKKRELERQEAAKRLIESGDDGEPVDDGTATIG